MKGQAITSMKRPALAPLFEVTLPGQEPMRIRAHAKEKGAIRAAVAALCRGVAVKRVRPVVVRGQRTVFVEWLAEDGRIFKTQWLVKIRSLTD